MKLFYTKRSPYARKVRVAAIEKGLDKNIELIEVDLQNKPAELLAANPLGKIPTLVLDNGLSLCDSPVICKYLDKFNETPKLISKKVPFRYKVLHLAALADGMMDAAVAIVLEKNRPADKQFEAVFTNQKKAVLQTIDALDKEQEFLAGDITLAHIAIASALGYIDFRLPDLGWRKSYPNLASWMDEFSKRPSMRATIPTA